jgi:hypothetical protein
VSFPGKVSIDHAEAVIHGHSWAFVTQDGLAAHHVFVHDISTLCEASVGEM